MECSSPITIYHDDWSPPALVPCGKCLFCLSNKRQEWSFRIQQEHRYSNGSLFVTLTYSDRYLPAGGYLVKRHLQLFMKRLRKRLPQRLRYYAVGEYGTKTERPHYHLLLFNIESSDQSQIRKAWPFGIVHIGTVNEASIMYCLKYIVQPQQKKDSRPKPFTLMSRAYGIGGKYLTDAMVDYHKETGNTFCLLNGEKVRMSRFYKSKIWNQTQLKSIGIKQRWQAVRNKRMLIRELKAQGVSPRKAIAEMRLHWLHQVQRKIKYSEKI